MSNVGPETRKVEQTQERSHTVSQGNLQNSGRVSGGNGQPQTGQRGTNRRVSGFTYNTTKTSFYGKNISTHFKIKKSKPGIGDTPCDTRNKTKGR